LGIFVAHALGPKGLLLAVAGGIVVFGAGIARRRPLTLLGLCATAGFFVGGIRFHHHRAPPPPGNLFWIPEGKPIPVRLRARVLHVPPQSDVEAESGSVRFPAEAYAIERGGCWVPCSGRLRCSVKGRIPDLARGDRIDVMGLLRDLPEPGNPGQFDFGSHLSSLGVVKVLTTPSPDNIRTIDRGNPGPIRLLERLRNALALALHESLPERDSALLAALLLGDQSRLSPASRQTFSRSGTIHLLAVSGLHLMLVLSGFYFLLRLLGVQGKLQAGILIASAWIFVGLTGARTPVLRAAIMSSVYLGAGLFGRERDPWNALFLSAGILLLVRPTDLWAPGFQLSFAAVMGILAFGRPITRFLVREETLVLKLSRFPADRMRARAAHLAGLSVAVSLSAWIATAPLVLHHFHMVTPVVPLANLVAAPLTAGLLATGFLALPLILLFPSGSLFTLPAGAFARLLSDTATFFSSLPCSHVFLPAPPSWRLALGTAFLILLALRPRWPQRFARVHPGLPLLFAGLLIFVPFGSRRPKNLEISFLDVGQGSATVLRFPDGRVLLYDIGTKGNFDVGEWVVAPFLWDKGVSRIDCVVLSHADTDHVNGLDSLLERFRVSRVCVPVGFSSRLEGSRILDRLQRRGVPVLFLHRECPSPPGWEDVLEVLHPPRPHATGPSLNTNNASLALRVRFAGRHILLPGDLERVGCLLLAEWIGNAAFNVVQVPHHGADEVPGNTPFSRGRPKIAVMSCGWSFSVERTAGLYRRRGSRVFRTCRDGAVTVRIAPDGALHGERFRRGPLPGSD
jgi:competence protein ComEC